MILYFRGDKISEIIDVAIDNDWKPLGVHYVHRYDSDIKEDDSNVSQFMIS